MPKGHKLVYSGGEIERIRHLYEDEGWIIKEIADEFDVSYTGMLNVMKRAGIERREAARKYTVNEHVFDEIDNEAAAYWYGFIYADGCVVRTQLAFSLAKKDIDSVAKLRAFMESDCPIFKKVYPEQRIDARVVGFSGIHLAERLTELGIVAGRPSYQPVLDNVPDEMIHHWIRGLFDGDGSATKSGRIVFCGGQELMMWLRDYFAEHAGTNPDLKIHMHQSGSAYYLSIGRSVQARKAAEVMYKDATIWMDRKRNMIDSWPEFNPSKRAKKGWKTRRGNKKKSAD